jgi:hypothetical protein
MRANRPAIRVTLATLATGALAFVLVGGFALAPAARADGGGLGGFRCGHKLVKNGETQDDVAVKCGDPDATRTWTEYQTESVWVGDHKIERSVPIEYAEWKYDFGSERLIRYLTFVQGRLRDVRTGSYGHH